MIPKRYRFIFCAVAVVLAAMIWSGVAPEARSQVPIKRVYTAALLFEQQGRYEKAAEMYLAVLARSPGHTGATERLGVLRQHLGDQVGAAVDRSVAPNKPARSRQIQPTQFNEGVSAPEPRDQEVGDDPGQASFMIRLKAALKESRRKLAEKTGNAETGNAETGEPELVDSGAVASEPQPGGGPGSVEQTSQPEAVAVDELTDEPGPEGRKFMTRLGKAVEKTRNKLAAKMRGTSVSDVEAADAASGAPPGRTGPVQPAGHEFATLRNQEQQVLRLADIVRQGRDDQVLQAAYVLGRVGPQAAVAAEALADQLEKRQGMAQLQVAEALIRISGGSAKATDVLIKRVSQGAPTERMLAASAMEWVQGEQRQRCIAALMANLDDPQADIRAMAALALGSYGRDAKAAVPALLKHVGDKNSDVARAVTTALQCIERGPSVSAVPTRSVILSGS